MTTLRDFKLQLLFNNFLPVTVVSEGWVHGILHIHIPDVHIWPWLFNCVAERHRATKESRHTEGGRSDKQIKTSPWDPFDSAIHSCSL